MFSYDTNAPIDYDVKTQNWFQLNTSLYTPCNTSNFLVNNYDITKLDQILTTVNQYNGLHIRTIAINGKIPGDTIVVPLGAEVILRVKNRLNTESFTMHVHGLDKQGLWYTDGVAFIQQCPIPVGSDYSYRFIADTPGTHFYHGHLGSDRGDGVVGGFVVMRPEEITPNLFGDRLDIGREYYALLQDIGVVSSYDQILAMDMMTIKYANNMDAQASTCTSDTCWNRTRNYDGSAIAFLSPLSAFLINNKGWHSEKDLRNMPSNLPLTTFLIKKGENIKFRLVNGGIGHPIMIWLEYHKLIVVAADGLEIKPAKVDAIVIFPGERYDILIQGLSNPRQKNYRFIFETMEQFNWELRPNEKSIGLANLQYEDSTLLDTNIVDFYHTSCMEQNKCVVLNCPFRNFAMSFNYICFNAVDLENGVEIEDKEVIEQKVFTEGYEEYFINIDHDNMMNGVSFKFPKGMPYYSNENENQIFTPCESSICNSQTMSVSENMPMMSSTGNCNCFNVYNFALNNIVQLTLYNMGNGGTYQNGFTHPFHLHGTHFYVMKLVYPPMYDENGILNSFSGDIPCHDSMQNCYGLKWTNSSWLNGNVEGMSKNPTLRDTIIVPTGGYVVIRFRAKNPGWWFAHCHLLIHDLAGMAFAVRVGNNEEIPKPPNGFPHSSRQTMQ
uniref:L-ascorbate oxidase n=1 Tax=Acrobeloides nanus TaxID=290746 RepID=A0A914EMB4_9BILA